MNHFPFMAPVSSTIINAIQNTTPDFKKKFSGAMPFVYFHTHTGVFGEITIGDEASYKYIPSKYNGAGQDRFPPLITNLEIKPTGTMGVVREASVTVKFASMTQIKRYQEFFRIGNAKTIVWGWNQNRITGDNMPDIKINKKFSKPFVGNIKYWQSWIKGKSLSADVIVGPLINFSLTLNNDASVDVVFQVGSPNEIIAYMGSHKTDATKAKSSDEANIAAYRVGALLNLVDGEFTGTNWTTEIRPGLLNYDTTQSTLGSLWKSASSFINSLTGLGTNYDNVSEDVYIRFGLIAKYAINQNPTDPKKLKYIFDLSGAVSAAHPNMISNSENVIFLNNTMANPVVSSNEITLSIDSKQTQNFTSVYAKTSAGPAGANGYSYPELTELNKTYTNEDGVTNTNKVRDREWGKVENVFFKVPFVQDIIKNNGDENIVNIIEKLCNEINIASCGLTDLAPQSTTRPDGVEVFTIVDYALVPEYAPSAIPPKLQLFETTTDSTIINVSFNCDLPKEIAAMTMLGNRKATDVGTDLFFKNVPDDVLDTPGPSSYAKGSGGGGGPGPCTPLTPAPLTTPPPGKFWQYDCTTKLWVLADIIFRGTGAAPAPATGPVLIDESVVLIQNDAAEHTFNSNSAGSTKAIFKNTDLIKNMYFGGIKKNRPLLPIELEITVLGIGGITAGQVLEISKESLPFNNSGLFQVKEVNHTVSNNTWETTIKLGFRPN